MSQFRPALVILILLTLMTGGLYPLITTLLGQWWFPHQANGSLIMQRGQLRGSWLIGQAFSRDNYFHGRPSATSEAAYNPMASGGSNLAISNPQLDKVISQRIAALRAANPQTALAVPVQLVTASASGLDYAISPQAAAWQIPRIARARHLPQETIARLVADHTQRPPLAFIGSPLVNVSQLNLALDALQTK